MMRGAALLLLAVTPIAAQVTLTLDSNTGSGQAASRAASANPPCIQPNCVLFTGKLTDTDPSLRLEDISVTLPAGLTLDNTFFADVPGVLTTGAYTGPIFGIDIAPGTPTGVYNGTVTIQGVTQNITVTVTAVGTSPQTITFAAPSSLTLTATASSGLPVAFASTRPGICTVSGSTVTVLAAGTCSITAAQPGNANYAAAPPVTQSFSVAPTPTPTGVANAASGASSAVAPGSYVAIYGTALAGNGNPSATSLPLPTTLNGAQVTLGGLPMPLLYASATQINALVPQALKSGTAPLVVSNGTPLQLTVTDLQPGIYTVNLSGSGPGVIANALTGQLISDANPAHASDFIVVYCTGLGLLQGGGPADGAAAPTSPIFQTVAKVTATIGGIDAPVSFAGLTPTLAGLYQVNVQVPAGVTPGSAVPIVISAGGVASNTVTLSLR